MAIAAEGRARAVGVAAAVAAVVQAVVAGFVERHDAVAAHAVAGRLGELEVVERKPIGRVVGIALGLEDHDLVDAAFTRPRDCPRCRWWPRSRSRFHSAGVRAADVDRQLAVHEYPDVIVAVEGQRGVLGRLVLEPVANLAREVEVVTARGVVAEAHAVEREEWCCRS